MSILLHSLVAAIATLVIGFVWYNPKVFGNAWMKSIGKTEEELKGANTALIFGLTFFFSFLVALALHPIVIHQFGIDSLLADIVGNQKGKKELFLNSNPIDYIHKFRTFKHGVFHGIIAGIFLAMPIIGINALHERRGAKYIFINTGYWIVSLAVMGGIISGWE